MLINTHRLTLLNQLLEAKVSGRQNEEQRITNMLRLDMTERLSEPTADRMIGLLVMLFIT